MWVRKDGAFEPLVSKELFYTARGIIRERCRRFSNEELISRLKALGSEHPNLSAGLIDASEGMPSSATYRSRFGSLVEAYRLAGFEPDRDFEYIAINRNLKKLYPGLVNDVIGKLNSVGASVDHDKDSDLLLINGEYSAEMVLSRCRETRSGSLRWMVKLNNKLLPDITILVRMNEINEQANDYYLLPIMDIESPKLLFCETNGAFLDTYQFSDLDYFAHLASRQKIEEAA